MQNTLVIVVFYVPSDREANTFGFLDDCQRLCVIKSFKLTKGCKVIKSPPESDVSAVRFDVGLDSAEKQETFLTKLFKKELVPDGWIIQINKPAS